jgi:uncharacterized protein (TIGR03435 family)
MKHTSHDIGARLDQLLARHRTPSPDRMRTAIDRVGREIGSAEIPVSAPAVKTSGSRSSWVAAVAAVAVAASVAIAMLWPEPDTPVYRVLEGTVDQNDSIRSNSGAGAVLELADGSRVEMRSHSALSLERANDGLRIRLIAGGIIVNAAKQRTGHLYVQTKEMTVSVVGTVFVVNADDEGSRVTVLEGEVRVRQGTTEKRLRPGERVVTSPNAQGFTLASELAWSRRAKDLLAMLPPEQQPATAAPASKETGVAFETISIRPHSSGGGSGRSGGGGSNMSPFAPGCAAALAEIDPRRFALTDVTMWNLITAAYGGNPYVYGCNDVTLMNVISGGPAWIKSEKWDVVAAVPDGVLSLADVPREGHWRNEKPSKLQKMIEALLIERLGLVVRRDIREAPAYALKMADAAAPKFTPPPFEGARLEEWKRWWDTSMPSGQSIAEPGGNRGKDVHMKDLVEVLAGALGRPVVDETGFTGSFSFLLSFRPIDNGNPFSGANNPRLAGLPTLFKALEQQLGLRLEETTTKTEFWVIERVERPTEN